MSDHIPRQHPEREQGYEPLSAADREWMEVLGCEWPSETDEAAWLERLNDLAVNGSADLRGLRVSGAEEVESSRHEYFKHLPVSYDVINNHLTAQSPPMPLRYNELMRGLNNRGIHIGRIHKFHPSVLHFREDRMADWIDSAQDIGIDAVKLINRATFSLASYSAENFAAKLMPMYAAARLQGAEEYRDVVHRFLEEHPDMLFRRSQYVRLLTRIAVEHNMEIDLNPKGGDIDTIFNLARNHSAHAITAAYVERGASIRSWEGLMSQATPYYDLDKDEVRARIAKFRGLAVVKEYELGYPLGDAAEHEAVLERHKRAMWRRRRDRETMPVDWQGPGTLGDPQLTAGKAFGEAVDYDLPSDVDLLRRELAIVEAQEERDVARELRMRRALVAIALPWVVKIAEECTDWGELAEKIAVGSLALASFTLRQYHPGDPRWWYGYKEAAIEAVMDAMAPYGPRFDGRKRQNIVEGREALVRELGGPLEKKPEVEVPANALSEEDLASMFGITPAALRSAVKKVEARQGRLPSRTASTRPGRPTRLFGGRAVQVIRDQVQSSQDR